MNQLNCSWLRPGWLAPLALWAMVAGSAAHAMEPDLGIGMAAEDDQIDALWQAEAEVAPQDSNASTSDHSVGVPAGWTIHVNVTPAQIADLLDGSGLRLAEMDYYGQSSGGTTFSVRMVQNSGAYAVPGWWWYHGVSFSDVGSLLRTNNARLIDLEPYDTGDGTIRYAAVMVANSGSTSRAWSYLSGVTSAQLNDHVNRTGHRLIDLDSYLTGGVRRYSAVLVANSGTDAKAWQYWYGQTTAEVSSRLADFNGRLVDIDRQSNGRFNIVLVRNEGSDAFTWWWAPSFTSATAVLNFANQLAARPVHLESYVVNGARRYAAIFIDNANAPTQRLRSIWATRFLDSSGSPTRGVFQSYLKRAGSSVLVDLNARRATEAASAIKSLHVLHALRRVEAGTDSLTAGFTYYQYPNSPFNANTKDACPITGDETASNARTNYNLLKALDETLLISDNRTTRGLLLRYGRSAIQATANLVGMSGTVLRSSGNLNNLGCFYYNPSTQQWTAAGNHTTAADLARLYESVWLSQTITGDQRAEFLGAANPRSGASSSLQSIINAEASAQGKSGIASTFGSLVQTYDKGGSYGGELSTGQDVIVRSGAGIIRLPVKVSGRTSYRTLVFGSLFSNAPVGTGFPTVTQYESAYGSAYWELFREEVRSALLTW